MWVSTVVFSVVFPGPEFAGECARVPRTDRLCAWLSGCVHGCQVVCMVVRLCAWLSGCVHGCQVVCMVVYRTWCGCRECATCVLSRPTVSHITCWLPFVLCVLDLIIVPCANYFVYLK